MRTRSGVTNPLQADDRWLRTRLMPGLLTAIRRNAYRQVSSVALFEVGTVFRMVDGEPEERPMAALAITGAAEGGWTGTREFDFFDAKGRGRSDDGRPRDLLVAWRAARSSISSRPFGIRPGR